jgi:hypothetical protein
MGVEKKLNSHQDMEHSWEQPGKAEWHHQVGDFWAPIFANLKNGGGWLAIDEIFDTGNEHRFVLKSPIIEDPWRRAKHFEDEEIDDPAATLFRDAAQVYQKAEAMTIHSLDLLFDFNKIEERLRRREEAAKLRREDHAYLERRVEGMLDFEAPPDIPTAVEEVDDWNSEIQNAWFRFSDNLQKSGLQQRVAIESFVRNRRDQWMSMNQAKRDLYTTWKIEKFGRAKADQILIRDLITSMECLHIPHTHYACSICFRNNTVHKETFGELVLVQVYSKSSTRKPFNPPGVFKELGEVGSDFT